MEKTNHYPNMTEDETQWLVLSAALRPDASVDDLMDSFFNVFPHRATHEGLTDKEIQKTLTSRFNDMLYRKDRGYAEIIAEKRKEYQQAFASVFSVTNPVSLMNFYEQTFSNPKSKPSDKFKAIEAAEKLNNRLQEAAKRAADRQRDIERQREMLELRVSEKRERLSFGVSEIQFQGFLATLPEELQEQIKAEAEAKAEADGIGPTPMEIAEDVLQRQGMHAEAEKLSEVLRDDRYDRKINELSPMAVLLMLEMLSHDTIRQPIAAVDVFLDYLDNEYPNHSDLTPTLSHLWNIERFRARQGIRDKTDDRLSGNRLNLPPL